MHPTLPDLSIIVVNISLRFVREPLRIQQEQLFMLEMQAGNSVPPMFKMRKTQRVSGRCLTSSQSSLTRS